MHVPIFLFVFKNGMHNLEKKTIYVIIVRLWWRFVFKEKKLMSIFPHLPKNPQAKRKKLCFCFLRKRISSWDISWNNKKRKQMKEKTLLGMSNILVGRTICRQTINWTSFLPSLIKNTLVTTVEITNYCY